MTRASETTLPVLADRIDNLEMKISYQEEMIEQLNKVVVDQWGHLKQFQRRIEGLERQLSEGQETPGKDPREEPPPPHY